MPGTYVTWFKQGCWVSWCITIGLSIDTILANPPLHIIAAQALFKHFHCIELLIDRADALHFNNVGCSISKALHIVAVLQSLHGFLAHSLGTHMWACSSLSVMNEYIFAYKHTNSWIRRELVDFNQT